MIQRASTANKAAKEARVKLPPQGRYDKTLFVVAISLAVFGVIMVYSASSYAAARNHGDRLFFVYKQLVGVIGGIAVMVILSRIDYGLFRKLTIPILLVSIGLLVIVLIPGIGMEVYGARRWIRLPFFTLQASEVSKFGFVLFAAIYMSKHYKRMNTLRGIIPVLAIGGLMCILIMLEPNMSITMVVGLTMLLMLFIGGMKISHFVILALPLAALVPVLIIMEPYRLARLAAFVNPWANPLEEGFQLIQSFYSLGSGGLFGVGLFNSRQKYLFLPFSESDFIFSIIGEELGLIGALMVIAAFVLLIIRAVKIARNSRDRLGAYMASGIACLIAIQVIVNIAVVTGSIPPTGLPLPFISAGSSSLIVFLGSIGILQSISRHGKGYMHRRRV